MKTPRHLLFTPAPQSLSLSGIILEKPMSHGYLVIDSNLEKHLSPGMLEWICGQLNKMNSGQWSPLPASVLDKLSTHAFLLRLNLTAPDTLPSVIPSQSQEAYALNLIPEKAFGTLEAATPDGIFRGIVTFIQLFQQSEGCLPGLAIADWPDISNRGYMLDVSRCKVPTMESLFRLVDTLAMLKLNQLQLYIEHTFAFRDHQIVWGDSSPFSAQEIRLLNQYCCERFIELVPNLNSFGHYERWLKHPEYFHLAECPEGFVNPWGHKMPCGSTLKPNEDSLKLLDSLFAEFLPNFTASTFNVGCDETWELGQGWSKSMADEKGKYRVYFDFLLEINKLAAKHGRQIQFWADIILEKPELVEELPENVTGMIWGYEFDHPFEIQCRSFSETGVPFYVVPGTSSWNTIGGRLDNAFRNLQNAARQCLAFKGTGYLITDWGDNGHHQTPPVSWPALTAGAALSWNFKAGNRLIKHEKKLGQTLDALFFTGMPRGQADILLQLGRTIENFKVRVHNHHPLNRLLFTHCENLADELADISLRELESVHKQLLSISATIREFLEKESCDTRFLQYMELATDMLKHATRKSLEVKRNEPMNQAARRAELISIIHQHEISWLLENRVGGLHESSQRLRDVLESY